MALDNAQFISELSITDPLGTDPLEQGDDQIRTTKRATQQSFPLIDAAVNITAAQMNQMAIKNEVNLFTTLQVFDNRIHLNQGTVANPSYAFSVQPDTGMYLSIGAILAFTTNGADRFRLSSTFAQVGAGLQVIADDGAPTAPTYSFFNQNDMGMYSGGAGSLRFGTAGAFRFLLESGRTESVAPFRAPDGSGAAPAYSFSADPLTGFTRTGSTSMGLVINGNTRYIFEADALRVPNGSAAFPGYSFNSDTTSGLFFDGVQISSSIGGTVIWAESVNGMFAAAGFAVHAAGDLDTPAKPGFAFGNDADTGMYRSGANLVSMAAGAQLACTFGNGGIFAGLGFRFQADGNANSPTAGGYTFSNDTDTGIFRAGSNQLAFATAGLNRMQINADGRLLVNGSGTIENRSPDTGTVATYQYKPGNVLFWEWASGNVASAFMSLVRYNNSGAFQGLPIQIDRTNGGILFNELPTTNPGGSNRLWNNTGFVAIT